MLNFTLEPTDDKAKPAFKDVSACGKWIGQLQFTNPQLVSTTLRNQLNELNRYPMKGYERLQILELMRETIHQVQGDYAKKLVAKPLPLTEMEHGMLMAIVGLWQALLTGYHRCLQAYLAGDKQLAPFAALLSHRCMLYTGEQILEYQHAGYEFEGGLWQQLHGLYLHAEGHGLLEAVVEDELAVQGRKSSCRYAYINILLLCQALPMKLTRTQQIILESWLTAWNGTVSIDRTYAVSRGDAPPLAIDLNSNQGLQDLQLSFQGNGDVRYIAMVPLSKLLRVKTILLEQGNSPDQLELGKGHTAADCLALLQHLHKSWCEARPERDAARQTADHEVQLCYGVEGIQSYIANKAYRQPPKSTGTAALKHASTLGYVREIWEVEDISVLGAQLTRLGLEGERLSVGQLVATRRQNDEVHQVGTIVWARVTADGKLQAGIRYLPGTPQAAVVTEIGTPPKANAALLLPAMPEIGVPATLLLPRQIFKFGLALELMQPPSTNKQPIKLGISVEKGVDFERVSFS